MSYFPKDMPGVEPDFSDRAYWGFLNERRLRFQGCARCSTLRHPPMPMCPNCHSTEVAWTDAPQQASLFTYTVVRHAAHAAVAGQLPYVVGVVEFEGLAGVRLVTNVTDIDPAGVRIGMPLKLWWDETEGQWLPRFRPGEAA
jgi:uncharacterized OB-fold protein